MILRSGMKILVASSELTPLARTGGLADAVAELTAELSRLGHEVSVVIPYYRSIREEKAVKTKKDACQIQRSGRQRQDSCRRFETQTRKGCRSF